MNESHSCWCLLFFRSNRCVSVFKVKAFFYNEQSLRTSFTCFGLLFYVHKNTDSTTVAPVIWVWNSVYHIIVIVGKDWHACVRDSDFISVFAAINEYEEVGEWRGKNKDVWELGVSESDKIWAENSRNRNNVRISFVNAGKWVTAGSRKLELCLQWYKTFQPTLWG